MCKMWIAYHTFEGQCNYINQAPAQFKFKKFLGTKTHIPYPQFSSGVN